MPVHRHAYKALQLLYALRLKVRNVWSLCAPLSTLLAKSEQQHGATGGTKIVPALNFTSWHTARYCSLGEQTEGRAVPKITEHLSAALEGPAQPVAKSPVLWASASGHGPFLRGLHQQMDAQGQGHSWVWGCPGLSPEDVFCFPAVSRREGKVGNLLHP